MGATCPLRIRLGRSLTKLFRVPALREQNQSVCSYCQLADSACTKAEKPAELPARVPSGLLDPSVNDLPARSFAPTTPDWTVLSRLFADGHGPFRHHMGLAKEDAQDFYAATAQAAAIRTQKQAILASPDADQYLLESASGRPPFEEFIDSFCPSVRTVDHVSTPRTVFKTAVLALEPDWLLLVPPDWRLVCASVCFPTRWSLVGKALQPLAEIHAIVPGLQQDLGRKIDVFFSRMKPGEGWGRANWGLSSTAERNQHPSRPYVPLASETPPANVYLRVESQNLCKLPGSGAMAFGIRILNFPLAEVVAHQPIVEALKQQLRTMPGEIAAYKGIPANFWERL